LPFDVDRARLSYQVQSSNGGVTVIAAVSLSSVIDEYESIFRDADFSPGVVLPSILACLGQVDASRPTLVVKVDTSTTSIAIVNQERLLLIRTLENPEGTGITPLQLAEEVHPSLVFFQDTYGLKVERILVGGIPASQVFAAAVCDDSSVKVDQLVGSTRLMPSAVRGAPLTTLGGVVGALVS
jgi:hypothetical protein